MLSLLVLISCKPGEPTFYDRCGLHLEAEGSDSPEESPLGPYLAGSSIHVYVRPPDNLAGDLKLELFSTDESVLQIANQAVLEDVVSAEIDVLAAGEARIELWKKDWNIGGTAVSLHDAAKGTLVWGPAVLSKHTELASQLFHPNLLIGGTTTFKVEYTDADGNPLAGSGIAEVIGGEPFLSALSLTEFEDVQGDWITLAGQSAGQTNVEVQMNGTRLATMEMAMVDTASTTNVGLYIPDEDAAVPGERVYAAALGFGAKNEPTYGLPVAWELDGRDAGVVGEVYGYNFDPDARTEKLGISVNGQSVAYDIRRGDPSDEIEGCQTVPLRALPSAAAMLALLVARRRRS